MKNIIAFIVLPFVFNSCTISTGSSKQVAVDSTAVLGTNNNTNEEHSSAFAVENIAKGIQIDFTFGSDFLSHFLFVLQKNATMTDTPSVITAKLIESKMFFNGAPQDHETKYANAKLGNFNEGIGALEYSFVYAMNTDEQGINEEDFRRILQNISGLSLTQTTPEPQPFKFLNQDMIDWCWQNFYRHPTGSRIGGISVASFYDVSFKQIIRTMIISHEVVKENDVVKECGWYRKEILDEKKDATVLLAERYSAPIKNSEYINKRYFPFASGFWIRRHIDGTEEKLWKYLKEIIMDYDYDWACNHYNICDRG